MLLREVNIPHTNYSSQGSNFKYYTWRSTNLKENNQLNFSENFNVHSKLRGKCPQHIQPPTTINILYNFLKAPLAILNADTLPLIPLMLIWRCC